jgi:molybdopterin biosynthesis enzyme
VDEALLERAERVAARGAKVVRVARFLARRVAVVVKESIHAPARQRFEASVRAKVESLGSAVVSFDYVADETAAVERSLAQAARGRDAVDLVLTAGGGSTDPADAFFVALDRLGGRVVRRGVPAHPGSMLWLGRVGRTAVMGLPTCGAYSKATAADLLLPRLLAGEPATAATVAKLGHGGILTRDQRFRFPRYARELDAPDG